MPPSVTKGEKGELGKKKEWGGQDSPDNGGKNPKATVRALTHLRNPGAQKRASVTNRGRVPYAKEKG